MPAKIASMDRTWSKSKTTCIKLINDGDIFYNVVEHGFLFRKCGTLIRIKIGCHLWCGEPGINDVHVLYRKTIDFYMNTMSELVGQTKGDSEIVGAINDD